MQWKNFEKNLRESMNTLFIDMAFKRQTYKYFGYYYCIFMVHDYDRDV